LLVAKPDATDDELIAACKKASIYDFVQTLPQGIDTPVEELGESLSGGERQRLGLARAFLHDGDFMLLDEPTSNLDSLNEAVILRALATERASKTICIVSHRPSTVTFADRKITMNASRLSTSIEL
jgi:ABC-type multidrug transport system fused ATPase/permease subunit